MKKLLAVCIVTIMLCCSGGGNCVTLTFDDVPSGTVLGGSYAYDNRVFFASYFQATDHTDSNWGSPRSGNNVLTLTGDIGVNPFIFFGRVTTSGEYLDPIQSVGAYFSTNIRVMVRITAYCDETWSQMSTHVTSVVIGDSNEAWNNRYVEISSPDAIFNHLEFEGVSSTSDLLGFCLDDMTITPVPEPSSLAALGFGVLPVAAGLRLRRRRR